LGCDALKIAITGASGLIGSALVGHLTSGGHEVVRLIRRDPTSPGEASWDPQAGTVDLDALAGTHAVVHLAGAGVGDHRWTESYKRQVLDSRVQGTTTIARAVASLDPKPAVLVSASATGWYGDTGDREVDESAPCAEGRFLADVVRAWERSADPAREAGIRVAHPRSGIVLSRSGGAAAQMLPFLRLGLLGPLGSGRQYWSVISLRDEVRALAHLVTGELSGPVNLCIPSAPTNAEMTRALGRVAHRPTVLPIPGFAIRLVVGGFAEETLISQRIVPRALLDDGFTFSDPTPDDVARRALER
jgi:uncharacterized protein